MVNEARQLDRLSSEQVIDLLLDGEARVLPAIRRAAPQLAQAVALLGRAVSDGGRLVFTGAGTSGRLAAAEAAELPGTFGLAGDRCLALIAGVESAAADEGAEDDTAAGAAAVRATGVTSEDVVIAVAASGRTPFTLAAAEAARAAGAALIAVVNTAASPLAALAAVAVEVVVGDEVLRGSTRLTAGTAQKIVLNSITTAAMARAGRVHDDLMIDVVATNGKLRARAAEIVAEIAGCPIERAVAALVACDHDARAAVVALARGIDPGHARELARATPSLRAALGEPAT